MTAGDEHQRRAWKVLHRELQAILYESDPGWMGSTVGAPDDEYFDDAINLIRSLKELGPQESVADVVRTLWPEADSDLISAIEQAWARYCDAP